MSESILDTIAQATRLRIKAEAAEVPLSDMRLRALDRVDESAPFAFYDALSSPGLSFICECKKASPSKGLICPDFEPVAIARDYEAAGAAAISCLTEPQWFQGRLAYVRDIANAVNIPVLRKDFTVDEYMLYEAKAAGAAAVLLIVSLLTDAELSAFITLVNMLRMDALVEAHTDTELHRALNVGARIIGVNNRNLKDFTVDFDTSLRLRSLVPDDVCFVAESGVKNANDVKLLADNGVDAVLIGETLMRADDKRVMLDELKSKL